MLQYARERFAVMLGWNPLGDPGTGMAKVVRIRLRQEVYGFGGLCQRMHETVPPHRVIGRVNVNRSPLHPPIFFGGAYQYYIPNLNSAHVQPSGTNMIP